MTPSEKKAREILPDLDADGQIYMNLAKGKAEVYDPHVVELRIASALDAAERRGFERAKNLMLVELTGRDFIGPTTVRNLKYEEA